MQELCSVCLTRAFRYKCPKCFAKYCCLECFGKHKITCVPVLSKKEPILNSELQYYKYKTEDTIPEGTLKLLESSAGVLLCLRNPHVKTMMDFIDKSKYPASALKDAMQEPIFSEFVEECLKVIEPEGKD